VREKTLPRFFVVSVQKLAHFPCFTTWKKYDYSQVGQNRETIAEVLKFDPIVELDLDRRSKVIKSIISYHRIKL